MSATVAGVSVDYLTVTTYTGVRTFALAEIGKELVREEVARQNKLHRFERWGYQGEIGGRVTWGLRKDGGIIQIAGELADREFDRLHTLANHVTRLDIAVDVRYDPPERDLARRYWDAWDEWRPASGFDLDGQLIQRRSGGSTLYVGSRRSARFARLYDKRAESGDPAFNGVWRWECEWKDELASPIAGDLASTPDRHRFGSGVVHQHFAGVGLVPDWPAGAYPVRRTVERAVPDAERHLKWLANGVRPAVNRLRGWGRTLDALDALGLNPATLPPRPDDDPPGRDHHSNELLTGE